MQEPDETNDRGADKGQTDKQGPQIPDIDELVRKGQEQLRELMGVEGNRTTGQTSRGLPWLKRSSAYAPPGYRAKSILAFLLPAQIFEDYFEQTIIDMREEVFKDYKAGRTIRARYLTALYHFILIFNFVAFIVVSILRKIWDLFRGF